MQKKSLLFTLSVLLLAVGSSQAQGGWEIIYPVANPPDGDGIDAVRQTADGGYILAGVTDQISSAGQSFVVKVNDQGIVQWSNMYSLGNTSWATNVEIDPAGGYFVSGRLFNPVTWTDQAYIQKLDAYGNQVWLRKYTEAEQSIKGDITSDGGYVMVGYYDNNTTQDTIVILKTDAAGNTDWVRKYPNQGTGIERLPHAIIQTANDEYVIKGYKDTGFGGITFLWRLDTNGDSLWQATYGNLSNHPEYVGNVVENADGSLVASGNDALSFNANELYLVKTDAAGTMLWQQRYGTIADFGTYVDATADGGYILTGHTNSISPRIVLIKTDANGTAQWNKLFDGDAEAGYNWKSYCVQQTADGGYIVGGAKLSGPYGRKNMYLVKTDDLGEIYSNTLSGYVYYDADNDCQTGGTEHRFAGWTVKATGAQTFITSTDTNGYYWMRVDTGNYELTLHPAPNTYYWETSNCTNDTVPLSIPNPATVIDTSFAQTAISLCPLLTVDLSTAMLRRCFDNKYTVTYCNNGTVAATDAYIDLSLDAFLVLDTASIPFPWSMPDTATYRIEVGTVGIGECAGFTLQVYVECTAVLGQTHCSQAHIYPDTTCLPTIWGGATISLQADCMGDSVVFYLSNTGSSMAGTLAYVVYEDNVLVRPGTFSLNAGQSTSVSIGATGGATYRIEAQQPLGFPESLGDSLIAVAIEGCGDSINTGFVTQFANFDAAPAWDLDCVENRGAYDPNDKTASPEGYGTQHYIYADTDLDYMIRFQNTGTDTAFTVVIRDTLDALLDAATLQMGSSSHPFTWHLYGEGVQAIEFIFNNIMLPDSHVNEPASHGFIKFSIEQQPNNPLGSRIENTAAIYFDFNAPIFTNTTFHELGDDFVTIEIISELPVVLGELPTVRIYPNPFDVSATIEVRTPQPQPYTFYLYDNTGRIVQTLNGFDQQPLQLDRRTLSAGLYFYRITTDNQQVLDAGKLIVR